MVELESRVALARRSAKTLTIIGAVLTPILAAAVGLPFIGQVFLSLTEPEIGGPGAVGETVVHIANVLPGVFLVMAVATLVGVFMEYAEGRFLSVAASQSFQRAGAWGLACVLTKMLLIPLVAGIVGGEGFAVLLGMESFDIGLLVFAVFVLSVGNVLETAAAALKAENDEIV
jgi:hypothetical protein